MECENRHIKEMIPAYLGGELGGEGRLLVEEHLGSCADCREEAGLLKSLIEVEVPDPGEDFWAAMPGRIYREVRKAEETGIVRGGLRGLLERLSVPGWEWAVLGGAAAAALVLVVLLWSGTGQRHGDVVADDLYSFEYQGGAYVTAYSLEAEGLGSDEAEALSSWASAGLQTAFDGKSEALAEEPGGNVYGELQQMESHELERLSRVLDELLKEV